jgi:hypothetical protein
MMLFFLLAFILVLALANQNRNSDSHAHYKSHLLFHTSDNRTFSYLQNLEHLGELYYQSQMKERSSKIAEEFKRMNSNFPCVLGETPLGSADDASVDDGHKFACGIHAISGSPIVYSFGSNQQQDFELAVLNIRPDAKIFVFELIPTSLPPENVRDKRITYVPVGLGGYHDKVQYNFTIYIILLMYLTLLYPVYFN